MFVEDTQKILEKFSDYLHVTNLLVWAWRKIAWAFLMGVKVVVDQFESLLNTVYKLVDFGNSEDVKTFVSNNSIAIYSVGAVCFLIFCISYMKNTKKATVNTLINNILLGIGVILVGATLTYTLTKGSFDTAKLIISGESTTANQIINSNIVDVRTFDGINWESTEKVKSINYDKESLKVLDITEEIDVGKLKPKNDSTKDVFNHKLAVNSSGKREMVKLSTGLFQVDEHYYRYNWHPWIILCQMVASLVVLVAASFKYTKSIFNSFFNGFIAPFFAFSDLIEGSKVLKIWQGIINTCINVVLFALSMKLYQLMSAYVGTIDANVLQKAILQLFLAFILVEGPYIIQELTGQDGGVRSESKALVGSAVGAAFIGGKAGKAIKGGYNTAKDKVRKGANFVSGAIQGVGDFGKDTLDQDMKNEKEQQNQTPKANLNPDQEMSQKEKEDFNKEVKEELAMPDSNVGSVDSGLNSPTQMGDTSVNPSEADHLSNLSEVPKGFEDIYTTTPAPEESPMTDSQSIAKGERPNAGIPVPESEMAKSTPLGEQVSMAMNEKNNTLGQHSLASQQDIKQALQSSGTHTETSGIGPRPQATLASFPMSMQAQSGVHEVQQGGFLAPMSVPASSRMTQILSPTSSQNTLSMPIGLPPQPGISSPVPVPESVNSLAGVQQFKQDLANSGKPITTDNLPEIIGNKWADHQIRKAEERLVYQKYNQIGRNTTKKALSKLKPSKERKDN